VEILLKIKVNARLANCPINYIWCNRSLDIFQKPISSRVCKLNVKTQFTLCQHALLSHWWHLVLFKFLLIDSLTAGEKYADRQTDRQSKTSTLSSSLRLLLLASAGGCETSDERLWLRSARSNLRSGDADVRCSNTKLKITLQRCSAHNSVTVWQRVWRLNKKLLYSSPTTGCHTGYKWHANLSASIFHCNFNFFNQPIFLDLYQVRPGPRSNFFGADCYRLDTIMITQWTVLKQWRSNDPSNKRITNTNSYWRCW